ncbi:MAG: hypothetical protein ACP5E3_19920, partial [Bacteroidales bacterium]
QITAAEWNDLDNWGFWNNLLNDQEYSQMPGYWSFDVISRISVQVKNNGGNPVTNVRVELLNSDNEILWTARTDNFGKAELWPGMSISESSNQDYKLRIDSEVFTGIKTFDSGVNEIFLNSSITLLQNESQVAFMVDATGSMADELEYLKVELVDVISEVKKDNPNSAIITGSVFYRDQGDQYLTRVADFTSSTDNTIKFIKDQFADGGGDFPEAVHTALLESITTLQWSEQAKSRILFILLDAPPHYENQVVDQIHSLVNTAAEKGIKLIPITASGIDKETEFLMRYFSIATNGTYVFITNDSGIGNEHLEASVGEYEVEYLNDLMVRLINKYLE